MLIKNLLKCLFDYSLFDIKNQILLIQCIVLSGFIISRRRKQRNKLDPKYHPKGVLNNYKEQVFFCRNGIQKMRCQVYCKWSTLMYQVKLSNLKQHKNTGNSNVSFNFQNKVLEYLVQIEHNSSESQATRVVREVMEIRVRDNGCNCVALPQQYSEIEIYQLYC